MVGELHLVHTNQVVQVDQVVVQVLVQDLRVVLLLVVVLLIQHRDMVGVILQMKDREISELVPEEVVLVVREKICPVVWERVLVKGE